MPVKQLQITKEFLEIFDAQTANKDMRYISLPSEIITTSGFSPTGELLVLSQNSNVMQEEANSLKDALLAEKNPEMATKVISAVYVPYTLWRTTWREAKEILEKYFGLMDLTKVQTLLQNLPQPFTN